MARYHQRAAGVSIATGPLPAFIVKVATQQAGHKRITRAQHIEHLHAHAGHRQAVIQSRWNGVGVYRTAERPTFADQRRLTHCPHLCQRLQRIGAATGNMKLLLGTDNHIKKMQYVLQLTRYLLGGNKTGFAVA
ncbi:hypothetical protein D3C73_1324850 [compost metagenome]